MLSKSHTSHMWVDPLSFVPRLLTKLNSLWIAAIYPFASKGRKLSVHYTCDIRNPQLMEIANDIIIQNDVWLHAWPSDGNTKQLTLKVGDRCLIGRRSHISAKNLVSIGSDVIISASVLIQDHGHAYNDVALPIRLQGIIPGGKIHIGEGSWIGQGAAIVCTDGELVLGSNCVIAANAVVTRSAPAFSVLSGNPARIVKQFDPVKGTWVIGASRPIEIESVRQQRLSSHGARSSAIPVEA